MKSSILYLAVFVCCAATSVLTNGNCYADYVMLRGEVVCLDCDQQSENVGAWSWGITERGFQTSVYISNKVYAVGESIATSVSLKNTLDRQIPFGLPSTMAIFGLSVLDPDGKPAALTDYGQRQAHMAFTGVSSGQLSSHHFLTMRYPLDRMFDFTKPGKYLVTARYCIPKSSDTNSVCAISNTVTVEVAAASSGGSISR